MMMTQDRANHPLATPTSQGNLNPSAPAFRQGQAAATSQKNLNPSAPAFCHTPGGEKPPVDGSYSGAENRAPGLLTNGDIHTNGTNYMVPLGASSAGMPSGAGPHPQGAHQVHSQGPPSTALVGLALAPRPLLTASAQGNPQPAVAAAAAPQQQPQPGSIMAVSEGLGGQRVQQQVRTSCQNPLACGTGEAGDNPPNGAVGVEEMPFENTREAEEQEGATGGQEYEYPDEVLAPIRKQMQFYFSNENLPSDKFLNQHMDPDKFIPLELFLDFGRIKPICNSLDQLLQAVESSSILELSEDRKKVRVSQCRKTLTLRGFPASASEEDVRQFILEMGAAVPTHIEFVMYKEKYSVWYVSFKDETAALNSFFQFHNQKAVYKDHNIGCCIKSSGTLAAAGYFPSSEESNQRRMAHHNQAVAAAAVAAATAVAAAPVHTVQSAIPQPQPQQAPALMQPYNTMQLHSYMAGPPAGIYYQQTPQGPYMGPYMTGMIQSWPTPTTAMDPGLIMQNNGLQPQHVRTPMSRPHLIPTGTGAQHRFNRPQRVRQNNLERSASERPCERPPVVSVTGSSRSSPRGLDGSAPNTITAQGAYLPRRATCREDMPPQVMPQSQAVAHQYVTPLVTQQQHLATSAAPTAIVSQVALEPMAVPHYQAAPQHHQHSVIVHTSLTGATPAHSSATSQTTSNPPPPPPSSQQQIHHHHNLPPPMLPPQQHHQQQQQQMVQQQHQNHHHHPAQHSSQHHQQQQQPPPQTHHHHPQQQPHQAALHHHPHLSQHNMMAAHHHHPQAQQQQHHSMPPTPLQQQHHQQPPPGNRTERRGRRKRDDSVRNQRSERNQSNRTSFSSQTPVAADNFTMEANSFPPLPGALNSIASLETSHESRMSDIVRGVSRLPGLGSSGTPRASSNTPSPVPTPVPVSLTSATSAGQHHGVSASVICDARSLDDGDSPLEDDATSSSQEDVDTDVNSVESRSVRSEPQSLSYAAEPSALPAHPRSQKAGTSGAAPATVSAQRQAESRQGSISAQGHGRGGQQYQVSPIVVSAATSAFDVPKLSYAQILALKNREAANSAGAGEMCSGASNTTSGTINGPGSSMHTSNNASLSGSCGKASSQPPNNAFRGEHGTYPGGQQQQQAGFRSSQRSSAKDISRSEGPPSSRPPNGSRRNSKENRTSNKFDRRQPDARQK